MFISRRSRFGHHGKWKDTKGNCAHTPIHLPIQQRPQTRGLDRHGTSTSAPQTLQRPASLVHGAQEVQLGFKLGQTRGKLTKLMSQRDILQ
ncbi:hypothetical protein O181_024200 [Austropuccinia psidii MF-1]|uniref:Uncharacterized protein n=1 Tax=Austropuccinia psidii MF-1 TaxID=1389203 RepID=A0A9Q3CKJ1_9BASI|nr:hypothetical protein [Austropuccinia psidii MF-1]